MMLLLAWYVTLHGRKHLFCLLLNYFHVLFQELTNNFNTINTYILTVVDKNLYANSEMKIQSKYVGYKMLVI